MPDGTGTTTDPLQYGHLHFLPASSSRTFSDLLQFGHFSLKYIVPSLRARLEFCEFLLTQHMEFFNDRWEVS